MITSGPIRLRDYESVDDRNALALERRCPQGESFRIAFARDSFHCRTAGFAQARLIGAWHGDQLVGIGGGAIKDVRFEGRDTRGVMLYDFRVDPQYRRGGVARQLAETLLEWAKPQAEIAYAFAIGDNRAIQAMAHQWIGADTAPAFDLLVYPTHRRGPAVRLREVDAQYNRARHLEARADALLSCSSAHALASPQLVGAWSLPGDAGGCSAWTNQGVLEEVVTGLPPALRAASWLLGSRRARRLGLPHVPRVGERLRSWVVFDGHTGDEPCARQLFAAVAQRASAAGIDHCHVVLPPGSPLVGALRRDLPKGFAPVMPFTIMAKTLNGRPLSLPAPVIDPQDI